MLYSVVNVLIYLNSLALIPFPRFIICNRVSIGTDATHDRPSKRFVIVRSWVRIPLVALNKFLSATRRAIKPYGFSF